MRRGYKSFAEDSSKSLGLGRLTRLALKPLFQNLVAIPMTWAFNKQYTPTLLGANEAVHAFNNGLFTGDQLNEELARHGYSTDRRNALQAFHTKYPSEADLFLLDLAGQLSSDDHRITLRRIGYDDDNINKLLAAEQGPREAAPILAACRATHPPTTDRHYRPRDVHIRVGQVHTHTGRESRLRRVRW